MGYEHIEVEISDHIGTVWLNRPEKLNALSADMWDDIPSAVKALDGDDSVRVIVLAGRGAAFTVGIDVGMLASLTPEGPSQAVTSQRLYDTIRRLQLTASAFADSPKPTIAAIHGFCLGAGMDLITACDIRVASADSTFSVRETKMGLVADVGTLQRLPAIVGPGHAAELSFTGGDIGTERAATIGLVNHVYADLDALTARSRQMAAEIASNSPLVVSGVKKVLAANRGSSVEDGLDFVAHWNSAHLLSNDLFEALSAFTEKRPPRFKGE
ncbi:MAG TPA: crotonase/enoyl-CoA hydratase family protein [Acidimicrobiia bacterium]